MNYEKLEAAAEAVLFASGDPVPLPKLAESLQTDLAETQHILSLLEQDLNQEKSGICLKKMEDEYQLCTKSEFADDVRSVLELKKNTPLSSAAFEVLAVIAYNQPVTRSFVDQVRGVDCSGVISSLVKKGLIEEKGRLDLPGKPILYGTTPVFLRCFCLESLDDLPALPNSDEPEAGETETLEQLVAQNTAEQNIEQNIKESNETL